MTPVGPRVSVVMPTFNRRDTIARAISSVLAQRFDDWELVVVDDGSSDGTASLVQGLDPRVRLIRQENQGVAGARNTALRAARGALIAFLDSDDVWPAHHLALATAFFATHPDEQVFTSEFWEDYGDQRYVRHFQVELADWYPATARRIGSPAFSRPAPLGDPYLRVYATRTEAGAWAERALRDTPYGAAHLYRGEIFPAWRWGWLMALQPTVITRLALDRAGLNDTSYRVASDFGFLAQLCRRFPVNMVAAPGCLKHERAQGGRALAEAHLVTGPSAVRFHQDVLRFHEELFCRDHPTDPELCALRGFRQTQVARAALSAGSSDVAQANLERAVRAYPGPDTSALLWLARTVRPARLASWVYRGARRSNALVHRFRDALSPQEAK